MPFKWLLGAESLKRLSRLWTLSLPVIPEALLPLGSRSSCWALGSNSAPALPPSHLCALPLRSSPVRWFGSEMFLRTSYVEGFVPSAAVPRLGDFGRWLDYKGSDISGLTCWWTMGRCANFRRWGVVGGSRWPRACPWRVRFVPGPFLSCLCFPAARRWAALSITHALLWCSASPWSRHGAKELWTESSETMSQNESFW
jgi:hypothetical protein